MADVISLIAAKRQLANGARRTSTTALTAVGFDRRAALVIAMAGAGKTLVNTVAHLSQVEIDAGFKPMPTL